MSPRQVVFGCIWNYLKLFGIFWYLGLFRRILGWGADIHCVASLRTRISCDSTAPQFSSNSLPMCHYFSLLFILDLEATQTCELRSTGRFVLFFVRIDPFRTSLHPTISFHILSYPAMIPSFKYITCDLQDWVPMRRSPVARAFGIHPIHRASLKAPSKPGHDAA